MFDIASIYEADLTNWLIELASSCKRDIHNC